MNRRRLILVLNGLSVLLVALFPFWAERSLGAYPLRILKLVMIYIVIGQAVNLVTGLTGMFAFSHSGFALIGSYVYALLTTSMSKKVDAWILEPTIWPAALNDWPFPISLILAAVISGFSGFLIAIPALRFRGAYLTIATLAFSEMTLLLALNLIPLTNGPLGIKAVPPDLNIYWMWGIMVLAVIFVSRLSRSAFGRALKCIRHDDRVAEVLGVDLYRHRALALTIAGVLNGVAGAMMASFYTNVEPKTFSYVMVFIVLAMVILGGLGSVTGTLIGAGVVTAFLEWARIFDQPIHIGATKLPPMPGLRMVILGLALIATVTFAQGGLMGTSEFSWDRVLSKAEELLNRLRGHDRASAELD